MPAILLKALIFLRAKMFGFEKSLILECLPIVTATVYSKPHGSCFCHLTLRSQMD